MKQISRQELRLKYQIRMWHDEKIEAFRRTLLDWYDEHKRDLPWRKNQDPYRIWISEIMLQQTQVITVIPYFERFMERFPNVQTLAEAHEDEVLKLWEGLGYYSRARNLHHAAKQIMNNFQGEFPDNYKDLKKLKGIGPYTAAAIASISFGEAKPAIDGNLMRVFARLFEIDLDIKDPKNRKVFEAIGLYLIDSERPGDFNQALMDLGATICTPKNYQPEKSPVKDFNASYLNDTWERYPVSSKNKVAKKEIYFALFLKNQDNQILFHKRPETGILANLWMVPLVSDIEIIQKKNEKLKKQMNSQVSEELSSDQINSIESILREDQIQANINGKVKGHVTHIFTHRRWELYLLEGELLEMADLPDASYYLADLEESKALAMPTVMNKMIEEYFQLKLF